MSFKYEISEIHQLEVKVTTSSPDELPQNDTVSGYIVAEIDPNSRLVMSLSYTTENLPDQTTDPDSDPSHS
jgi:hypothetical protein